MTSETPPTFLFHTSEDTVVPPENSILFYMAAAAKAKVPAELHIYEKGTARRGSGAEGSGAIGLVDVSDWLAEDAAACCRSDDRGRSGRWTYTAPCG